ncbi:hypothetical protein WJX74_009703 [Apatococcus lobatus]|uniref:Purple acid phosphatase n=1 Tax=Apatococcus lobatus TaxID=904363 RepID=A0AAW1RJ93_9CHLO
MSTSGIATSSVLLILLVAAPLCRAQGYTPQTPTTVPYDNRGLGSPDVALTDPRLASNAMGNTPEQVADFLCPVNTCLCGANTCYTSQYGCKNGTLTQNPTDNGGFCPTSSSVASIVRYGTTAALGSTATGSANSYTVNNAVTAGQTYVSGLLHSVTLTGLSANTQYYYTVGDGNNAQSMSFNLKTLQAVSPSFSSYRIGVFADLGLTTNSTMTVEHLVQSNSQAFINIGDFVYADNYTPNAANRWDGWYRYLQQLLSYGPMIAVEGNHEIETQLDGTQFAAYKARYGNDVTALGGSGSPFYFSVNVPGAHIVVLAAYGADYSVGSAQYNWLQADLAKVDRTQTPFIISLAHPPVYNTYKSHYKELECMRQSFEPLLYKAGVDLAMYGHVHAYERTNRVNNYINDNCGITHITVGDGGNSEQLQTVYVDDGSSGACPAPVASRCPTYQAADAGGPQNGFCPPKQPLWSAFREAAFGHGTLDITPTQLVWSWHRNQDGEPVVSDTITIDKGSFGGCANHPATSG